MVPLLGFVGVGSVQSRSTLALQRVDDDRLGREIRRRTFRAGEADGSALGVVVGLYFEVLGRL